MLITLSLIFMADTIITFCYNFVLPLAISKEKVSLPHKTIFNVLNNYIPHETVICDGKNPQWFSLWINSLIENKNKLRKNY